VISIHTACVGNVHPCHGSPPFFVPCLCRFVAIVPDLIKRHLQCTRHFLQRFDGRNSVAVLNAGDVTPQLTCSFLDVALGQFSLVSLNSQTLTYQHGTVSDNFSF
jgi:hypothetical protein